MRSARRERETSGRVAMREHASSNALFRGDRFGVEQEIPFRPVTSKPILDAQSELSVRYRT
jgi:hypothetical protein